MSVREKFAKDLKERFIWWSYHKGIKRSERQKMTSSRTINRGVSPMTELLSKEAARGLHAL